MGNVDGNAYSLRRWLVAAALACLSLTAHAVKWDRSTDYYWNVGNGNITSFPGQGTGNMWSTGSKAPTSTGPQWTGPTKQLPFNPSPTANFKAKFTPTAMAKALANPLNLIPLAAAPILNELLNQACMRAFGGTMELAPGGQWEECNYKTETGYEFSNSVAVTGLPVPSWRSSREASCSATKAAIANGCDTSWGGAGKCPNTFTYAVVGATDATNGVCQVSSCSKSSGVCGSPGGSYSEPFLNRSTTSTSRDLDNPWKPSTSAAAEAAMKTRLDAWTQADFLYGFESANGKPSGGTGAVLDSIINSGNSLDAEIVAPTVQTPINEAPVTTTTTNPDGSTKTETEVTTNDYSCLVISNGAAVECKQYKTTTKTTATSTNPNGTGTVTTTATAVTSQQTKPGEQVDQCAKYPDSLGCAKLNSETVEVPKATRDLTYTPDASFSFGGGSCPAPFTWTDSLGSHAIDLAPWCDKVSTVIRPLVIALALLAAVFIILPRET